MSVMLREIGIDEAGRGPVIGSLFVAGVLNFEGLGVLGVRDSKKLSSKRREQLAKLIENATEVQVMELTAKEIDERRKSQSMNEITVDLFARIIELLHPDRVYVDAADVNPERFASNLRKKCNIRERDIEIISEFKADENYPVVSAASIVAKVHRDKSIRELATEIGAEIGSGYPADPRTIQFLNRLLKEQKDNIPDCVRQSWKTFERLCYK
ncbi:MAG: ribonuclease HII [Methanophagales archaeon]|nr:ribonuclease HII [Methanophagales archaeon]MCW7072498.1 ribonuclease HII [Methanophagales archaeon]